jgi:hypothetical protein
LYTHSVNGITAADIQLAKLIDELPVKYSRKWANEHVLGPNEQKQQDAQSSSSSEL